MSQENVEIVQRVVNHFATTLELDAVQDALATDWVLDLTHATRVPDHLPYHEGLEGWRTFCNLWSEQFDPPSFEWQRFYDAGDRVVVLGRQRAVAKVSRLPVEQVNALVYTLRDKLITRMEIFNGTFDEALKAVGLEE